MVLKFKQRGEDDLKKVLIYGADGTGKSTFAADYCRERGLNPVVIDIDDTNYTNLPVLELSFKNDVETYKNLKDSIREITRTDFDTIILDGVSSMMELLTSKAKGLKKYSDRAERFNDILRLLQASGKHLIFVGQADMEVIFTEDFQSPKPIIKINSIVNEKYLCYKKKQGFSAKCVKFRTLEAPSSEDIIMDDSIPEVTPEPKVEDVPKKEDVPQDVFLTAGEIGEPKVEDDPVRNSCILIKEQLEKEGIEVTKWNMKARVIKLIEDEILPPENREPLVKYIYKHCPEELP